MFGMSNTLKQSLINHCSALYLRWDSGIACMALWVCMCLVDLRVLVIEIALDPKPYTALDHKSNTLNPQPSTVNHKS